MRGSRAMRLWHKLWRSLKGDCLSFEALLPRDNDTKSSEPEVLRHSAADADNEYAMIDATIMRAHQHSAGAKKKPAKTKPLAEAKAV
ncbi:MAG: hypothetical protein QOD93_2503 [Acetobacteraceae bacterium]|nr:hypothetical protein [Acetobacteraceae bacterium]